MRRCQGHAQASEGWRRHYLDVRGLRAGPAGENGQFVMPTRHPSRNAPSPCGYKQMPGGQAEVSARNTNLGNGCTRMALKVIEQYEVHLRMMTHDGGTEKGSSPSPGHQASIPTGLPDHVLGKGRDEGHTRASAPPSRMHCCGQGRSTSISSPAPAPEKPIGQESALPSPPVTQVRN